MSKSRREDRNEIGKLNVMLKMYDISLLCTINYGKPVGRSTVMCWRPYPYRMEAYEDGGKTVYMFGTIKELQARVHILIAERQELMADA